MKFFVSYSRSVKTEVGALIKLLRAAGHEVWWDGDIPTIADWWATILANIEQAEIMLFMVSEKSVQSPYCLEELRYGIKLNRPVLPFIMDDHSGYAMPPELGRRQWYIHDGDPANTLHRIIQDCGKIPWEQHQPRRTPRPPEPNSSSGSLTKQFQQAVSLAESAQFEEATQRFANVSSLDYGEWGADCQRWIARLQRYADIADLADHKSTLGRAKVRWDALLADDPEAADFDPLLVQPKLNASPSTIPAPVGTQHAASAPTSTRPTSLSLMPAPFAWIEIPNKGYSIAKYPITNSQFAKFIEAGGYNQRKWWTDAGWEAKLKGWNYDDQQHKWVEIEKGWTTPRYWMSSQPNPTHPIIGVSWYESVAFCLWLSDSTGEKIMLPTEDQWQYAAQGADGRYFPWGMEWSNELCNSYVNLDGIGKITSVLHFKGKGDSPFGVVDMVGNVSEWCLTDYDTKSNDINSSSERRVLRGGSWYSVEIKTLHCDHRDGWKSRYSSFYGGFRICRT